GFMIALAPYSCQSLFPGGCHACCHPRLAVPSGSGAHGRPRRRRRHALQHLLGLHALRRAPRRLTGRRRKGTEMPKDSPHDPWLLTPGPLTTSATVKQAMLHDWGSRDDGFIAINRRVRERLVALAGGEGTHACVPVQGSGTFAVEAMLGSFVPKTGKVLIL